MDHMLVFNCDDVLAFGVTQDTCCSGCHAEQEMIEDQLFECSGDDWVAFVCCKIYESTDWDKIANATSGKAHG